MPYSSKWGAEYRSWKGEGQVTVRDHAILTALDEESQSWWKGIHLTQGGLSSTVSASARTHDGLGSFDVRSKNNTKAQVWKLSSMFLRSGIIPFPRGYNIGYDFFRNVKHIHAVSRESYHSLHQQAKAQYKEYDAGGDGLVGAAKYTGPSTNFERWSTSPYNPANWSEDTALYYVKVTSGFLYGLDVDRHKKTAHDTGTPIQAARRVKRWGRVNVVTPNGLHYALDYLTKDKP